MPVVTAAQFIIGAYQFCLSALALGDVMDNAGKQPPLLQAYLADSQFSGENGAILALSSHLASNANDLLLPGAQIARKIVGILFPVERGHEHPDVLSSASAAT